MTHPSLLDQWDVDIPTGPDVEKTYVGRRSSYSNGAIVVVIEGEGERPLEPVGDQRSVGFEWGYNGAGPTALAAALLGDHLGYEAPITTVIAYRQQVISRLRSDGWAIGSADLRAWLSTHCRRGRP